MKLTQLVEHIKEAGVFALRTQSGVARSFKADGSVVTSVDLTINRGLSHIILEDYPDTNLLAEEEAVSFYSPENEYTFVLDPLDGTDTYSMGMPGWCIALGLLRNLEPVGGIIYAPSWGPDQGSFIIVEEDGDVTVNGHLLKGAKKTAYPLQVMAPSTAHRFFDYSAFKGKVRNSGSSIISMAALVPTPTPA